MDGTILTGVLASAAAGAATGVGALPMLAFGRPSDRLGDTLLGFAAGVMLAASFFSLILPGIDEAAALVGEGAPAVGVVIAGILLGAAALWAMNRYVPHEHFVTGCDSDPEVTARIRRIWLFVLAITIHNVPEGLAVGVGFGGQDAAHGWTLATAIGLQNMPEGLAVATALAGLGYGRLASVGIALGTGMVEPLGALLGVGAVTLSGSLLPVALGFAAGAMLFVISNEIIPETHRKGHEQLATSGLMVGLVVMMFLDVTFAA